MTKKSNLYTRSGDKGRTSLVGGQRIAKDDQRLEAYGTVDELNSWIAVVAADTIQCNPDGPVDFKQLLLYIENKLFDIGGYLATDPNGPYAEATANPVSDQDIARLEQAIDAIDSTLPVVNQFVLPGCSERTAHAHVARTVCRRAERRVVTLASAAPVDPIVLTFLNRLSDLLFAIARFNTINAGQTEIFWSKDC